MTQSLDSDSPQEFAARLRSSYLNFRWPLFLLTPEERSKPCLDNGWSPLAMVAHVAWWDAYQLRRMEAAVRGADGIRIDPPPLSNDERAVREDRSWEAVLEEADDARRRLIEFAISLRQEQIDAVYEDNGEPSPLVRRLLTRMPQHVDEHAADVHRYCFSLRRWGREQILAFYRRQFNHMLDSITGLSEETCVSAAVCGGWSLRDILTHILVWDEYTWEIIRRWPQVDLDVLAPWISGNDDAVNARLMARKADLTMIDLLDRLATVHRRICGQFRRLADDQLSTEVAYNHAEKGNAVFLLISMAAHTADHAAAVYAARAEGRLVPLG